MYSNENNERERMKAVLLHCLDTYFKLLHPFMPFVSEELWQHLPILSSPSDAELKRSKPAALGECLYPSSSFSSPKEELEAAMKEVMGVVHAARSLRDAHSLRRSSFGLVLRTNDLQLKELFEEQKELICHLAKAGSLDVRLDGPEPHGVAVRILDHRTQLFAPLATEGESKEFATKEIEKLLKKKQKLEEDKQRIQQRMSSEFYAEKVPESVRQKDKESIVEVEKQLADVDKSLSSLNSLIA
ncbi:Valine--tRNA ligase [Balamuthia mandrillaris]